MEKTLKTMESRHSLKQRWKPGDLEFDTAVILINKERRNDTLKALHALSIERHFLLTLKKKYAGNFAFFFHFHGVLITYYCTPKPVIIQCMVLTSSVIYLRVTFSIKCL